MSVVPIVTDQVTYSARNSLGTSPRSHIPSRGEWPCKKHAQWKVEACKAAVAEAVLLRIREFLRREAWRLRAHGHELDLTVREGAVQKPLASRAGLSANYLESLEAVIREEGDFAEPSYARPSYKLIYFQTRDGSIAAHLWHDRGEERIAVFTPASFNDAVLREVYDSALARVLELESEARVALWRESKCFTIC